jgi:hypothetical protein
MNWSQVIAILIGAVLAIVTASITKYVTDWYDSRVRRSQISRFLAAELSSCVSKIESLLSIYKESKVPDPTFLLALERAATLFQGRREMVYLLDVNIGQQVLRFYDEIDNAVDMSLYKNRSTKTLHLARFRSRSRIWKERMRWARNWRYISTAVKVSRRSFFLNDLCRDHISFRIPLSYSLQAAPAGRVTLGLIGRKASLQFSAWSKITGLGPLRSVCNPPLNPGH